MSSDVIYYDSTETGTTTLNATAGTLVTVMDAILVNGFNAKTAVSVTVAAGLATMVVSTHNYKTDRKLLVAGATPTGLNGIKRILSVVDANTVTFDATGVADGVATGTITCKRAPLGWTKVDGDSTHGLYKRKDLTARANLYRLTDSSGQFAFAGMVDTGTSMSAYTNLVPTVFTDGGSIIKSGDGTGTARQWFAMGDGTSFYIFIVTGGEGVHGFGFGDLKAYRSDDTTASFVIANSSNFVPYWVINPNADLSSGIPTHSCWVAHSFDGTGGYQPLAISNVGNTAGPGSINGAVFPSPYDNGVPVIENMPAFEANYIRPIARGSFPGMACSFAPVAQVAGMGVQVFGPSGSGKVYNAYYAQTAGSGSGPTSSTTSVLLDSTGPWQ